LPTARRNLDLWIFELACGLRGSMGMTITRSFQSWALMVPLSLALGAWADPQDSSPVQEPASQTIANAIISNGLPVDGCSYPVTIDGVQYAPDPESLAAVQDRVPAGGELRVRIRYRLTGQTGVVECGFGTSQELPEISFRVVRVLPDKGQGASAPSRP
jgi:hypothetical protein